jgi:hypothetical protein
MYNSSHALMQVWLHAGACLLSRFDQGCDGYLNRVDMQSLRASLQHARWQSKCQGDSTVASRLRQDDPRSQQPGSGRTTLTFKEVNVVVIVNRLHSRKNRTWHYMRCSTHGLACLGLQPIHIPCWPCLALNTILHIRKSDKCQGVRVLMQSSPSTGPLT